MYFQIKKGPFLKNPFENHFTYLRRKHSNGIVRHSNTAGRVRGIFKSSPNKGLMDQTI